MKTAVSVAVVTAVLALTGCGAGQEAGDADASPTATPATTPTDSAAPTPEPTEESAERPTADTISCESMLEPLVDQTLRSFDLLPFEKSWTQFNFQPTGAAIECPWGVEGSVESATHFSWSALAEGEAEQFLALTAENGYTTTEDEQGTWVISPTTRPENSAILVTDEWIAYAPTPELIPAIVWTR